MEGIELTEHMKSQLKYTYLCRKHELELELERYNIDLKGFLMHCQCELGISHDWVLDTDNMRFIPPPKPPNEEKKEPEKQRD